MTKLYWVSMTKQGGVEVEAESAEEAMDLAEAVDEDEIKFDQFTDGEWTALSAEIIEGE